MKGKRPPKHSEFAKEQIRTKALERGVQRQDAVESAVTKAMLTIELEIKANDGLYPVNGGALTFNELMRRAGIGLKTLFGPKYKEGLKKEVVDPWLLRVKTSQVSSRREAKKGVIQRVAEWRSLYEDLLASHHVSELDLHETKRRLQEAEQSIEKLRQDNRYLLKELDGYTRGDVIPLRRPHSNDGTR